MSFYAERACDKKRHRNEHGAKRHIRLLVESGHAKRGELYSYRCPDCGYLHVGHPDETRLKARLTDKKRHGKKKVRETGTIEERSVYS